MSLTGEQFEAITKAKTVRDLETDLEYLNTIHEKLDRLLWPWFCENVSSLENIESYIMNKTPYEQLKGLPIRSNPQLEEATVQRIIDDWNKHRISNTADASIKVSLKIKKYTKNFGLYGGLMNDFMQFYICIEKIK